MTHNIQQMVVKYKGETQSNGGTKECCCGWVSNLMCKTGKALPGGNFNLETGANHSSAKPLYGSSLVLYPP
jgi:hypothetical protein